MVAFFNFLQQLYQLPTFYIINGIELFRSKHGSNGERVSNAMNRNAFSEAWGALPSDLAAEITNRIYKVNTDWDPNQ